MAKVTVGELVAAFLEQCSVKTAFGVFNTSKGATPPSKSPKSE